MSMLYSLLISSWFKEVQLIGGMKCSKQYFRLENSSFGASNRWMGFSRTLHVKIVINW